MHCPLTCFQYPEEAPLPRDPSSQISPGLQEGVWARIRFLDENKKQENTTK